MQVEAHGIQGQFLYSVSHSRSQKQIATELGRAVKTVPLQSGSG